VSERPRFELVPTLGVCLGADDARALFDDALGLKRNSAQAGDDELVYESGELGALFVDARGQRNAPVGFLPMFATPDLEAARAHLTKLGYTADPLPWAPDAPAFLVRAPGGASFCVGERRPPQPQQRAGGLLADSE
jgi:hypothetical protein